MNKLILVVLIALATKAAGQDCNGTADCISKANKEYSPKGFEGYFDSALKAAKKEGKGLSDIYIARGIKYFNYTPRDSKACEKDFKSAIKENGTNLSAHLWLAYLYSRTEGGYDKALTYYNDIFAKFPGSVQVLKDRADHHRYYERMSLALIDYEMAYNIALEDGANIDEETKADAARWYAELNMRERKLRLADEQTVKILEDGSKMAPNNARLLGELALAYYDVGKKDLASETGKKGSALDKRSLGSVFVAIEALEKEDYWTAATLMSEIRLLTLHRHPLIYYYHATASWAHIYNKAQNQWAANKYLIKSSLEAAAEFAGTPYDWYATDAKRLLGNIN